MSDHAMPRAEAVARRGPSLAALGIVPGAPIPSMGHIAKVALDRFRVLFAAVTLCDGQRPFVAGRHAREQGTDEGVEAFNCVALEGAGVVVIDDMADVARYRLTAPVVAGRTSRFYAAAPLALPDGTRLGTLCVLDQEPRTFNTGERIVLQLLAAVAADELRLLARGLPAA
jgi:GAF domain-containing protein